MAEGIDYQRVPKERASCACCGGDRTVSAISGDRHGLGLQTVVCARCGLIYTNPRPTIDWFDEFYREHYRTLYDSVSRPDDSYVSQKWLRPRHESVVGDLARWLPESGRMLDVGCAEGTFLEVFGRHFPGWEVAGIEPSETFASYARSHYGLDQVTVGTLADLDGWEADSFDLLTANHLLEHLLDPNQLFRTARGLLKVGGAIFVEVPNLEGMADGIDSLHIAHLYHFTARSLRNFFDKHGFRVELTRDGTNPGSLVDPWTLQMIGRKQPSLPDDWRPPRVSAQSIASSIKRRCDPSIHRRILSSVRRVASRLT